MSDALDIIEVARKTGKVRKGANEVTKLVESGKAKFVAVAKDVSPAEIVMHIPIICKEKKVPCIEVETRAELGASAGLKVGTTAVAVTSEGDAKEMIAGIAASKEE